MKKRRVLNPDIQKKKLQEAEEKALKKDLKDELKETPETYTRKTRKDQTK